MTTDWPDDNPSAHRALAIYAQTVPLGAKAVRLANIGTSTILPSGTATIGPFTVGQIGYEISIDIGHNVASTNPITQALLTWTDSVTGRIVEQQRWGLAGGVIGTPQTYYGSGPSSADTLTVTFTNTDTVNGSQYALVLAQNSRVYARHDWRQQTFNPVPSFSLGNYNQAGQFMLNMSPNVAVGTPQTRLIALYPGLVRLWATFALPYDVTISAIDRSIGVAPAGNQIWEQTIVAAGGGIMVAEFALPRCTCTATVTNNGGATSQVGLSIVAAERQP